MVLTKVLFRSGEYSITSPLLNKTFFICFIYLFTINMTTRNRSIFEEEAGCSDIEEDLDCFEFSQGDLDFLVDDDVVEFREASDIDGVCLPDDIMSCFDDDVGLVPPPLP